MTSEKHTMHVSRVLYISLALSSVVIPPFMINRLGCKLTIIASMFIYVLYLFINFRPRYYFKNHFAVCYLI